MGFPGYAGWTVVLDPTAVSSGRTELDINSSPFFIGNTGGGVALDWGTSELTEYVAAQGRYGSTVADYVWPNRTITITLLAGDNLNEADVETALEDLRQKVALFQREGGWLQRQRLDGPNMYADIVDAQLAIPDVYAETGGVEPGITLTLTALPDFFGDAVTLDTQAATGVFQSVLTASESAATIGGDHPARAVSLQVTDTSGNNQLGLLWGLRSRYYSNASTAELAYEAETLTPTNGAVTGTFAGASGGAAVGITGLPGANWVTFLTTEIKSGSAQMTHTGTYNVWARVYSSTGTPQLQFLWGMGDLSVPVTNNAVSIPTAGSFYLVDLGPIRLDAPPVGTVEWFGALQVYSPGGGDNAYCDVLYFQPLDDGAGQLTYVPEPAASSIGGELAPTTAVSVTGIGTVAWTNPDGALTLNDGDWAYATLSPGTTTNYLKTTGFGFDLPSTATVVGIEVTVVREGTPFEYQIADSAGRLVKAGTIQSTNRNTPYWWNPGFKAVTYGGSTDLWGGTWAYSDVNNSGFGFAVAATNTGSQDSAPQVDSVTITVYYTLASGFTVSQDAVLYANQSAALRFDGMYREGSSGSVYGSVSNIIGDLVRIPASGMEDRPCQVFVKPTRGDLDVLPDSGLDGFTVQATLRPSYIFRP